MTTTQAHATYLRRFPFVLVNEATGDLIHTHVWALNADAAVEHLDAVFTADADVYAGWTYEAI